MKFYRYPLALVAYTLLAIFALAFCYHYLGKLSMARYWYYFPAGAAFYLLVSVILSKIKLQWEWDVAVQVALVLAPVLWYVNIKEPYKRPVYIFIVNSGYRGNLDVNFNHEKDAPTNARSTSDTLYFKFDEDGQILLNEDAQYIQESMRKRLFFLHPDASKTLVNFADKKKLPADSTQEVLVLDTVIAEKGKMQVIHYRVDFPQNLGK